MKHAMLSASGAFRWLICSPSAKLESDLKEQYGDQSSVYAEEGTTAHLLSETMIKHKLGKIKDNVYKSELRKIEKDEHFNESMYDYCDEYSTYVVEKFNAAGKGAMIFLEQRLDMTDYIPEGFGTTDVVIICDHVLEIIDLKYGKGVPVSAEENKQMMVYALGAIKSFDWLYEMEKIKMTIYQPRLDNISTFEIEVDNLLRWGTEELIPKAELAFEGEGEFVAGKHCQFCKAKASCRAHMEYHMSLAKYDFKKSPLMSPEEISDVLTRGPLFKNWITAVEEHALIEALNNKTKYPGFKLVEGRSNRKYLDEQKVIKVLTTKGKMKRADIVKEKVLGITELTKLIGKLQFDNLLSSLLIKPPGAPTLVVETDKRPEYNSSEAAKLDFNDNE